MTKGTKKKKTGNGEEELPSFKGLKIENFSDEDIISLNNLFSVLSNEKRLDILREGIVNKTFRLKDLAKVLGEKNSAQIALHAKKLHDAGLLKKEGRSLRDTREYVPAMSEMTYTFLKIAAIFADIVNSRHTEFELEQLKANAEATTMRLADSPIMATASFSEISTHYDEPLEAARERFIKFAKLFTKLINVSEL